MKMKNMKKRCISFAAAAGLLISSMTVLAAEASEDTAVRIGALKGPTSMGLVSLMDQSEKGETENSYEFTMVTAADELLPQVISGQLDIALIPANVASILYQRTQGEVRVIDINTLGVLYAVSGDDSIESAADLRGKTIYLTGKGTTPDYVLQYLLEENGIALEEVTLEYKSEAAEVAAILAQTPDAVGILPQPFATVALSKNEALKTVLDLTEEWDLLNEDGKSRLVTGVTVARSEFLEENPQAAAEFLENHKASTQFINGNVEEGAALVEWAGIVENAAIAKKAIPYCNITCITGEEMKEALSGYLEVLYGLNPESVGGALPEEDFYQISLSE